MQKAIFVKALSRFDESLRCLDSKMIQVAESLPLQSDNPLLTWTLEGIPKSGHDKVYLALAVVSRYAESIGCHWFRWKLDELLGSKNLPNNKMLLSFLLDAEYEKVLTYQATHMSTNDLYGNWLDLLEKLLARLEVKLVNPKLDLPSVKRKVRRRGYRDHGSLLPNHQKRGWLGDSKLQLELEELHAFREQAVLWNRSAG